MATTCDVAEQFTPTRAITFAYQIILHGCRLVTGQCACFPNHNNIMHIIVDDCLIDEN